MYPHTAEFSSTYTAWLAWVRLGQLLGKVPLRRLLDRSIHISCNNNWASVWKHSATQHSATQKASPFGQQSNRWTTRLSESGGSLLTWLTVMLKLMLNMCKPWHDCKTGSTNAYSTEIDSRWWSHPMTEVRSHWVNFLPSTDWTAASAMLCQH